MNSIMSVIEEVERTQAELDLLYAQLVSRAGDPYVDAMLDLLRLTDGTIEETRWMAISLDPVSARGSWKGGVRLL